MTQDAGPPRRPQHDQDDDDHAGEQPRRSFTPEELRQMQQEDADFDAGMAWLDELEAKDAREELLKRAGLLLRRPGPPRAS